MICLLIHVYYPFAAHFQHNVLLFLIGDFHLEFSMFLTFSLNELLNSFPLKKFLVLHF